MLFSFIGLGKMGTPLARNIMNAGEELMVYARTASHAAPFEEAGARVTTSLEELAECDVLCTCLPLPQHVTGFVLGEDGQSGLYAAMKPGAIHVEFSTIDPGTAERMAAAAKERGIAYVQCTVGKTPAMAAKCEEPLFIGGDREAVAKLMPVFEKIGQPRDVDTVVASCAVKLLSNLIGMTNLVVLAEGMRIGQIAGMDLQQRIELLQDTGARSFQMDVRGPWMASEDFASRFDVDIAVKDLTLGCNMAEAWGFSPVLMQQAKEAFIRASKEGHGKEDGCAVVKIMK